MKDGIIAELEEQRRDALVAYCLGQIFSSSAASGPLHLATPEDLYEYLLVDNQVSAQVDTSRVAQGIASLQQYIHAIYNGMEPGYSQGFGPEPLRLWREGMSQYSVWAGYQMIEDYPENYIDPTLRLGKTSQFQEFENDLGQSRINQDSVQTALKNYLSKFEMVSNLKIVSGYIDGTDFRNADYYFVGRQNVEPFTHYWRKAAFRLSDNSTQVPPSAWSEWKPIDVAFDARVTHARAVVLSGRLHLVWVEAGQPHVDDDGKKTGRYLYSARMAFKQLNDTWSPATSLFSGVTADTSLGDPQAAEAYFKNFRLVVSMDVRNSSDPRLVVCFEPQIKIKAESEGFLRVYDKLFHQILLTEPERTELLGVAAAMFGNDATRLQFPFAGIDLGSPEIDWQIDNVRWDASSPYNYPKPGDAGNFPDVLSQELELVATLHMRRNQADKYEGGTLELQGICRAVRKVRTAMSLDIAAKPHRMSWSGKEADRHCSVTKAISGNKIYGVVQFEKVRNWPDDGSKVGGKWYFQGKPVGTISEGSYKRVSTWADKWNNHDTYEAKVELAIDLKAFPSLSNAEVQAGAEFKLQFDDGGFEVGFDNLGNRFLETLHPIKRKFGLRYASFSGEEYQEQLLQYNELTLNGAARTPVIRHTWTNATTTIYAFAFGVAKEDEEGGPVLGWNRFVVTLIARLRDVPKVVITPEGAQFLDLQTLRLTHLSYVRLNSLFAKELTARAAFSAADVLSWEAQHTREPPMPGSTAPVPLDFKGANGRYFWELFFHVPHLVAHRLHNEFDYLGAETWLHYVFNPQARIQPLNPAPSAEDPYWCVRPLLAPDDPDYELGGLGDPDAIAYGAPSHYRKAIYMVYLNNLIARGDMLYRQLTRDALNEAKLLYARALSLLGPLSKGRSISHWIPRTLQDATVSDAAVFSAFESSLFASFEHDVPPRVDGQPWLRLLDAPWFRVPVNAQLLDFWERLALRLGNLRNNLSLDGKPLLLALYEPPANPLDLLRAQLAGGGAGQRRLGSLAIIPPYRFRAMLPRAQNAVETLIRFGDQVRSYMELQDRSRQEELQQSHVLELSKFGKALQQQAIELAQKNQEALAASRVMIASRQAYYARLRQEDVSRTERQAMALQMTAGGLRAASSGMSIAAHVIDATIPNKWGTSSGPYRPAGYVYAVTSALETAAMGMAIESDRLATSEHYRRRREEWEFLAQQAEGELAAIDAQIEAQEMAIVSARTSLEHAEKAQQQALDLYSFIKNRATGPGLYQWLLSQMATLYFQAYDVVLSMCLATEASWQYEVGDHDTRFVPYNAWSDNRHGLTAGEALKMGLLRMESAFLARHERRLELTKTISLRELLRHYDAGAELLTDAPRTIGWEGVLEQLTSKGEISFDLRPSLFDQDYPGHYLRQLVRVSVSLPVVLGPYQDIHATLVQHASSTLLKPDIDGVRYLYAQAGDLPAENEGDLNAKNIVFNPRASQQIGLSSGIDDHGMFTLDFGDERYFPFEGTGAVSRWTLNFPRHGSPKQKEVFESLTDIILHVRYLAVDGGRTFAAQVEPLARFVEEQETSLAYSASLAVSEGYKLADGVTAHLATVTVIDAGEKPVPGVHVAFPEIKEASRAPAGGITDHEGKVTTHVTAQAAGDKSVSATLIGGISVIGSPKTAKFFAPDASRSSLETTVNGGAAGDTQKNNKVRATVYMTDGSLAPEGTAVTFVETDNVSFSAPTCSTVGDTGQCEVAVGSTKAGIPHKIMAKLDNHGSNIETSASFVAAANSYGHATMTVTPDGPIYADGSARYEVEITARDRFGNPRTMSPTSFYRVRDGSPSGTPLGGECKFTGGGTSCKVRVTSLQPKTITLVPTTGSTQELGTDTSPGSQRIGVSFIAPTPSNLPTAGSGEAAINGGEDETDDPEV